ncbi:ZIP family metal transporter [Candidatus Peregrinibacteria bacterium]|nr:ZIP family metal transporter [Candidatus Peregrinibacteria bacterium]
MIVWIYTIASVIIVSLISFVGILAFLKDTQKIKPFLIMLVSFSAGALFGDAFIHLLPETVENNGFTISVSLYVLSGILLFFILEKFIQWHHCHAPQEHEHATKPLAFMNLFGDGLHNFIDGAVIAGSYLVSIPLGITTTIAVVLHEIPQEIGDFGVLLHSGLTKSKALMFNFFSATAAILGAIVVLLLNTNSANAIEMLVPFTAGGFIYIAGTDLMPEIHKEIKLPNSILQFLSFIGGIAIMSALLLIEN